MAESCLKSLRGPRAECQAPDFQGVSYKGRQIIDFLEELTLCARYSLVLLEDLPALETSCIPKDKPAFERLSQEHRRAYEAVQGYMTYIFDPATVKAEKHIDKMPNGRNKDDVRNTIDNLQQHTGILRRKLEESSRPQTINQSMTANQMPSRSPWVRRHHTQSYQACYSLLLPDSLPRHEAICPLQQCWTTHLGKWNAGLTLTRR